MRDAYIWQIMAGRGIRMPSLVGQSPTKCKVAMLGMRLRNLIKVDEIGPSGESGGGGAEWTPGQWLNRGCGVGSILGQR